MNTLLILAFKGTAYHGFQVQANALSVCTVLQDAMEAVFFCRPDVKGCSRTDAGVHARGFCLNFHHEHGIPMDKLPLALNRHLPRDVRVLAARAVPEDFHARYSALSKEYRYVIFNSHVDDPFTQGLYYRVAHPLDTGAMHEAGAVLCGRHDFSAFCAAGSGVKNKERTVKNLTVDRREQKIILTIEADGFLYNMVRIIGGTLLEVGMGKRTPEEVAGILAARDRARAGQTLPPQGLFLNRVFYKLY